MTLITVLAGIVAIVSYIRHDQAAAPTCADVVGRWDWLSTGGVVAFTEDGLMHWYRVAADPVPLVNGTWVCRDRSPLHLTLTWTETRLVDTLVVSADGQRLAGENLKNSFKLSATRQR